MNKIGIKVNEKRAGQSREGLKVLEKVFEEYNPEVFIELGTAKGGMAEFLNMYGTVYTYDIEDLVKRKNRDIYYNFKNIFSYETESEIKHLIENSEKVFVFCDNGKKPKEFKTFSKYLKKGDLIFVHDFNREIFQRDVDDFVELYNLKPVFKDRFKKRDIIIRGWVRK